VKITGIHGVLSIETENTLAPGVYVGNYGGEKEKQDPPEKEAAHAAVRVDLRERGRPGVKKDDFHIKEQKSHGQHVKTDMETLVGAAYGVHARFVGDLFSLVVTARPDETGKNENDNGGENDNDQQKADGNISVEIESESMHLQGLRISGKVAAGNESSV